MKKHLGVVCLFTAVSAALLSTTQPAFAQWSSGSGVIYETGSNVGIGTTSPGNLLEVAGGAIVARENATSGNPASEFVTDDNGLSSIWVNPTYNPSTPFTGWTRVMTFSQSTPGYVGIGTTAPGTNLDVQNSSADAIAREYTTSTVTNTAARHSVKTSLQEWQFGTAYDYNSNELWIADITNSIEKIQVYPGSSGAIALNPAGGYVGVGTSSPSYTLHVNGSVAGTSAYNNLSDVRFKKDIEPVAYGLDAVMKLRPIGFDWKDQDQPWQKGHQIGLAAQEVENVVPEVVTTADDAMHTKSIAYGSLVPVLIKAIQEQQAEIDALKHTLAQQRNNPALRAAYTLPK